MKDDSLSFLVIFHKLLYQVEEERKIKNKNNYQIDFSNYLIFKNCFQISSRKLFYKIDKQKHIQNYLYKVPKENLFFFFFGFLIKIYMF